MILNDLASELEDIAELHSETRTLFLQRVGPVRERILKAICAQRKGMLDLIWRELLETSGHQKHAVQVLRDYMERSDWALFDVATLGTCLIDPPEYLAELITPRVVLYHALRMLDDIVDGHLNYKGLYPTALGVLMQEPHLRNAAMAIVLLGACQMALTAVPLLDRTDGTLVRRTLAGMFTESVPAGLLDANGYAALVEEKSMSYSLILYSPFLFRLPSKAQASFEPFMRRSLFLAQIINDLHDRDDDAKRGQPNYWLLPSDSGDAVRRVGIEFNALSRTCYQLTGDLRWYASARTFDLARYALHVLQVGLAK